MHVNAFSSFFILSHECQLSLIGSMALEELISSTNLVASVSSSRRKKQKQNKYVLPSFDHNNKQQISYTKKSSFAHYYPILPYRYRTHDIVPIARFLCLLSYTARSKSSHTRWTIG